jgi:anti-sigma B factor antagonist
LPLVDPERLTIDLSTDTDPPVARISGELDIVTAEVCKTRLSSVLDGGVPALRLELGGLGFVDSSGLGALVALHHHAESTGSRVELAGVSSQVRRLMEITRLDELFTILDA